MSEEIWFFSHLIVPLTDVEGRMRLNNKNKTNFILYYAHLIVPLIWLSKVLTFGKPQINLVFLSLNRTFVPKIGEP